MEFTCKALYQVLIYTKDDENKQLLEKIKDLEDKLIRVTSRLQKYEHNYEFCEKCYENDDTERCDFCSELVCNNCDNTSRCEYCGMFSCEECNVRGIALCINDEGECRVCCECCS